MPVIREHRHFGHAVKDGEPCPWCAPRNVTPFAALRHELQRRVQRRRQEQNEDEGEA